MKKIKLSALVVSLALILAVGSIQVYSYAASSDLTSGSIAIVEGKEISKSDYQNRVQFEKNKWEKAGFQKNSEFYQETALKGMVLDILIPKECEKRGIKTSNDEVIKYLSAVQNVCDWSSLVKDMGFDSYEQYMSDPKTISATNKALTKAKLRKEICSPVPLPTEDRVQKVDTNGKALNDKQIQSLKAMLYQQDQAKAWNNFQNNLIATSHVNVTIPVKIK